MNLGNCEKVEPVFSEIAGTYLLERNQYPNLEASFLVKRGLGVCIAVILIIIALSQDDGHIQNTLFFLGIGSFCWTSLVFFKSLFFKLRYGYLKEIIISNKQITLVGKKNRIIKAFGLKDIYKVSLAPTLGNKDFLNFYLKPGYASIPANLEFVKPLLSILEANSITIKEGPEYHPG